MSKEEFRAWLQELETNYELTPDKKVEYKATFDGIRYKGNPVAISISFRKEYTYPSFVCSFISTSNCSYNI